jgi:hypothetical protein
VRSARCAICNSTPCVRFALYTMLLRKKTIVAGPIEGRECIKIKKCTCDLTDGFHCERFRASKYKWDTRMCPKERAETQRARSRKLMSVSFNISCENELILIPCQESRARRARERSSDGDEESSSTSNVEQQATSIITCTESVPPSHGVPFADASSGSQDAPHADGFGDDFGHDPVPAVRVRPVS